MRLRKTKTKNTVAEVFKKSGVPLTMIEVYTEVHKEFPDVAYSTVYRIIRSMVENKKLNSLDFKERGGRFEWANRDHHHHLTCKSCGEVEDIDDSLLNFKTIKVAEKTGFIIDTHSIELTGICEPCRKYDQ